MAQQFDRGLVLHLDPEMLLKFGSTTNCIPEVRVNKAHFFACVDTTATHRRWTPLYSVPGKDRVEIPTEAKTGHDKWTAGASYYHLGQLWIVPHKAVAKAAEAGGDKSTAGSPNRVKVDALPSVDDFGG